MIYNHYNIINVQVSRSAQDHEDVSMALLYAILTEPTSAAKVTSTMHVMAT